MGVKISSLPVNTLPYTGSEQLPLVQSGETRAGTLSSLTNYLSGTTFANMNVVVGSLSAYGYTIINIGGQEYALLLGTPPAPTTTTSTTTPAPPTSTTSTTTVTTPPPP